MSQGGLTFIPWLRRGLGGLAAADQPADDTHVKVQAAVALEAERRPGSREALTPSGATVELSGPGEIIGFDANAVVRMWPAPGAHGAETNYFPLLELHPADLPWRYSPEAAASDRLRPWLCVVVLKDAEFIDEAPEAAKPLPSIIVLDQGKLPPLTQSWAWAHAQLSGAGPFDPAKEDDAAELERLLDEEGHRAVARVLCPRRLDELADYHAFLVPAYRRGRLAGLGLEPGSTGRAVDAWPESAPADSPADRPQALRLPVYHRWRFQTGANGDFESLARRLTAGELPDGVGKRALDVSAPGLELPPASSAPLALDGALKRPGDASGPWDSGERTSWLTRLKSLLDKNFALDNGAARPLLPPPAYGRWHAGREFDPAGSPPWFQDLNGDPRRRAAAGIGAAVVQDLQQGLMAEAWRQVEGVERINAELRQAQAARELAARLHGQSLASGSDESVLLHSAPLHGKIMDGATTVAASLHASPVGEGLLDPSWRRLSRANGPLSRRRGSPGPSEPTALSRTNAGTLVPAPVPGAPDAVVTPQRVQSSASALRRFGRSLRIGLSVFVNRLTGLMPRAGIERRTWNDGLTRADALTGGANASFVAMEYPLGPFTPSPPAPPPAPAAGATPGAPGSPPAGSAGANSGVNLSAGSLGVPGVDLPGGSGLPAPTTDPSFALFGQAAADLLARAGRAPAPGAVLAPVDPAVLRQTVASSLDPRKTVSRAVNARLSFSAGSEDVRRDDLDPVMAYPEFPRPMYEPLASRSQDWLLPGLEKVPADRVSLLETNQEFVEAYMVGLNHEMARELLWNGYPTDQRGSYFRQFWDPKGYIPEPGETPGKDDLKDIVPLQEWKTDSRLGGHSARKKAADIVLLVRGELLRRYPTAVVYAARAEGTAAAPSLADGAEERHPLFTGALDPDVSFFGFPLTEDEARGDDGSAGWFFVIQQQPSEPHFGLDAEKRADAASTWGEISWEHLAADPGSIDYVDFSETAARPVTTGITDRAGAAWGKRSADLAFIGMRKPVRVAIHAKTMLPPRVR